MMLRTMMPRTRLEWVEKLAGAGMWIAIGASSFVVSTRPEWKWAAAGCIMTLAVVSAAAGIPRRLAGAPWPAPPGVRVSSEVQDEPGQAGPGDADHHAVSRGALFGVEDGGAVVGHLPQPAD